MFLFFLNPYPSLAQLQFFDEQMWSVIIGVSCICVYLCMSMHAEACIHVSVMFLPFKMSTCFRIYLHCISHADVLWEESRRHGNHEPEGCFLAICTQVTSRMWQQSPLIKASKCDCSLYTSFSFPLPCFRLVFHSTSYEHHESDDYSFTSCVARSCL